MDAIVNWFRGLPRNIQLIMLLATFIFILDEIVIGLFFGAWDVTGFIIRNVNWGAVFLALLAFGGYAIYRWFTSDEEDEEEEYDSWDLYR